jgi:hypothetical protein
MEEIRNYAYSMEKDLDELRIPRPKSIRHVEPLFSVLDPPVKREVTMEPQQEMPFSARRDSGIPGTGRLAMQLWEPVERARDKVKAAKRVAPQRDGRPEEIRPKETLRRTLRKEVKSGRIDMDRVIELMAKEDEY